MKEKTTLYTNKPESLPYSSWADIEKAAPQDSTVVAWLDNELKIDKLEKFNTYFEKKEVMLIQRLRIFNKDAELHVWRSKGVLKGRLRQDKDKEAVETDYEETEYLDARQLLWGTEVEKRENDTLFLREDRGTKLTIPNFIGNDVNKNTRIFIKTRNYIGFTPSHHATYVDCRFVEFVSDQNA